MGLELADFPAKVMRNNVVAAQKKQEILEARIVGNILVTTTTKIFSKALRYKWEAYCNTNGRRTAIQMGGVLTVFLAFL